MSASTAETLVGRLCLLIARACRMEPDGVTGESRMAELGLDSLTLASVLAQMEAAHGIELRSEETLELLEAVDVHALAGRLAAILASRHAPHASG